MTQGKRGRWRVKRSSGEVGRTKMSMRSVVKRVESTAIAIRYGDNLAASSAAALGSSHHRKEKKLSEYQGQSRSPS